MSRFKEYVIDPVMQGMSDKAIVQIPLQLERVNRVFNLHRSRYTLIGGNTGSGKTAFLDDAYVLKAYDWWKRTREYHNIKIKWIYFSMERRKEYKFAKWTCHKLWMDYGLLVDVDTVLGYKHGVKISPTLALKIAACEAYFEELMDYVDVIDGVQTPSSVADRVAKEIPSLGEVVYRREIGPGGNYTEVYDSFKPYNPDSYTFIIVDHIGKISDKGYRDTKEAIDETSQALSTARDRFAMSPVVVSQFNRAIGDTGRMSIFKNDLAPILEDFKGSGNTQEDADLVLALFNPFRYKAYDKEGKYLDYPIRDGMIAPDGGNRFRSLSVLKNSFGLDDKVYGMKFLGECGHFSTLPKPDDYLAMDQALELIAQGF